MPLMSFGYILAMWETVRRMVAKYITWRNGIIRKKNQVSGSFTKYRAVKIEALQSMVNGKENFIEIVSKRRPRNPSRKKQHKHPAVPWY